MNKIDAFLDIVLKNDWIIEDYKTKENLMSFELLEKAQSVAALLNSSTRIIFFADNSCLSVLILLTCLIYGKDLFILEDSRQLQSKQIKEMICPDLIIAENEISAEIEILTTRSVKNSLYEKHNKIEFPHTYSEGRIYLFTTGTSNVSKGIGYDLESFIHPVEVQSRALGLEKNDTVCILPPISHAYGMSALFSTMLVCKKIILLRDTFDFISILKDNCPFSVLFLPPIVMQSLASQILQRHKKHPIRSAVLAGGRVDISSLEKLIDEKIRILNLYGSTESGMCFIGMSEVRKAEDYSRMMKAPIVDIMISDDGELLVRGENIASFFLNEKGKTLVDDEGWYHTGDLGIIKEGYFELLGRKDNIIVLNNGYNINVEKLEESILRQNQIEDCQIIVEKKSGFDVIVLAVVSSGRIDLNTVNSHIEKHEQIEKIIRADVILKKRGKKIRMKHDDIVNNIYSIISRILSREVNETSGALIEDLGMDSMHLLMLITQVEREYSIKIDILRFDVSFTLDEFADLIQESIIMTPYKKGDCDA